MEKFRAIVVNSIGDEVKYELKTVTADDLSEGEVLIKVAYSSVNYKDMLAVQKNGGVIRNYPMIPGIDLSGTVVSSTSEKFAAGEDVIVTGFDMGMTHTGGFSEYARVKADWVVKLPENLSLEEAMIFGTAGFTAALSVIALEKNGMSLDKNPRILVTGATGGVGSIALQILSKIGYTNIIALVRKDYQIELAKKLGANSVIHTDEMADNKKPLSKPIFDFVLDTVGGETASGLIPQISYGGSISMCGNAGGIGLNATVLPLILRGINILGIDSVNVPIENRGAIWDRMANAWNITRTTLVSEVSLETLPDTIEKLKNGRHLGRTIVKLS